jgi:hypothetical protein
MQTMNPAQARLMSQHAAVQNQGTTAQNNNNKSLDKLQPVDASASALPAQHAQGKGMRKTPQAFTFLTLLEANATSFAENLSYYIEPLPADERRQTKSGKALGKTLEAIGQQISQALANPNDAIALPDAITPDMLNSFEDIRAQLHTPSTDINKSTNSVLPHIPLLVERSHAEIALHFILEAKINKATAQSQVKTPPVQITPQTDTPLGTPPIQINPAENKPAEIQSPPKKSHALDSHHKHSVSAKDHRCWLRSLWFVIFSQIPKEALIQKLSNLFPKDASKVATLVSTLHTETINHMIESMNHPTQAFQFSEKTETALFDLSNQILETTKQERPIANGAMADTGQMHAIAEALDISFVQSESVDGPLVQHGTVATTDSSTIQKNITDQPVIIGGRGFDLTTGKDVGEDHFSLYLPRDTPLFQTQLASLKE